MPVIVSGVVEEGNTFDLYFNQKLILKDGTTIVTSAIVETATLKITLKGDRSKVVNNRSNLDVKDCFDATGQFLCKLTDADAVILSTAVPEEVHVATLTVVTNGAEPQKIVKELEFKVINLATT